MNRRIFDELNHVSVLNNWNRSLIWSVFLLDIRYDRADSPQMRSPSDRQHRRTAPYVVMNNHTQPPSVAYSARQPTTETSTNSTNVIQRLATTPLQQPHQKQNSFYNLVRRAQVCLQVSSYFAWIFYAYIFQNAVNIVGVSRVHVRYCWKLTWCCLFWMGKSLFYLLLTAYPTMDTKKPGTTSHSSTNGFVSGEICTIDEDSSYSRRK